MIIAKKLVKSFKSGDSELVAVNAIDIEIPDGQFLAVTGRSGSGKSTLLYQLGALDVPTSGEISIDDVDIVNMPGEDRTRFRLNHLGYVFQDYALLAELSAVENVMVPLLMKGLSKAEAEMKSATALIATGLGERLDNLPSQLSGGEQQRVSIARAIAHEPKIIFADEPTANLDSETSKVVLEIFLRLHERGQTVIMVTHEPEYAALAERVIKLSDGVIESDIKGHKYRRSAMESS